MYSSSRSPILTDLLSVTLKIYTVTIQKNTYSYVFPKVKIPSVSYLLLAVGSINHKVEVLTCCYSSLLFLSVSHSITSAAGALMLVNCLTANRRITSVELRYCVASVICEKDFDLIS